MNRKTNSRKFQKRDRPNRTPSTPRDQTPCLTPLSGLHPIDAVFRYNPFVVEEFYFSQQMAAQIADAANFLRQEGKIAEQADDKKLAQLAQTPDHDGVVALAKRAALKTIGPKQAAAFAKEAHPLLIVEGKISQTEAGELIRSAVYYGIEKIFFADSNISLFNDPAAYRSARGGLDMAELRILNDLPAFAKQLRKSYYIIGSHYEGEDLLDYTALCPAEELGKPLAIIIPASDQGLAKATQPSCHSIIAVTPSQALDRLSLASEAALLLQKYVAEGV
ncbi:MAG: RNA methyltransferase [Verrucomicrobiota bacterium]